MAETKMDDQKRIDCWKSEKAIWEKAAKLQDRSVANWMRLVCNEAAEKQLAEASKRKEGR
ncbi:hypothetical protein KOR42_33220 [Thalassoglobus neptunius]|uniref:Uncharacterized protein n=1 Tax=Thalassoglobus neptunius TaxID=1938619 RepID=A0A5C5WNZ5_9PLAN|nr:hypothetical protein [Thalassoglobus neptunius]TWT51849.1 hypothetical protein KOR42_33220 [Thalassoglobus neptunius]